MSSRLRRDVGYVVAFLLMIFVFYVSAYGALVGRGYDSVFHPEKERLVEPIYPVEDEWVAQVFEPIHAIDRRIRTQYWSDDSIREAVAEHRSRPPRFRLVPQQAVRE